MRAECYRLLLAHWGVQALRCGSGMVGASWLPLALTRVRRHLATGINVVAEDQIQRSGVGLYKRVDVDHEIVLPKKGEAVV